MVYSDPPRHVLALVTPPTEEPVTLEEAMEHLNIGLDDRHFDGWLTRNIPSARQWCEGWLGRALAPQTLEISFGGNTQSTTVPTYWQPLALNPWVGDSVIELPYGPVISVSSVSYVDTDGATQTMDAADYYLAGDSLSLAFGGSWPTVQARRNAIQIRYLTGYTFPGDSPSPYSLPAAFHSAMLLVLGHLFQNRENSSSLKLESIPLGAQSLMDLVPGGRLRMGMA